ncbi:MAG: cysteine desulfurase [Acetatifactor sp.]|nr:cysteine desulfurase [Acetatifactor sp.]
MKIYADNAATTKMSEKAIEAMMPFWRDIYGNPSSPYEMGQKAKAALEDARRRAAAVLNCEAREIYFTSGGSEADNQAIISAARLGVKNGKKHIISTTFEHHAVLHTLDKLKGEGFEIELLDVHSNGVVTGDEVANAIREDTALVTVMYANNEIGTLQPIREIGAVCREKNVLFHTDAVQAIGHVSVDVDRDNIDMLSLSAHKFHGPKGVGILYARKGINLFNIIEGGGQERGKRAGTENLPGIVGMVTALEDAAKGIEEYRNKLLPLRDKLIAGLDRIPFSELNGDREKRLPGTVNFCFEGIEGESLFVLLDGKGISASSGSACTSGSLEPSHVLLAIGRTPQSARGSLRLSLSDDVTEEEIDYLILSVEEAVRQLRNV